VSSPNIISKGSLLVSQIPDFFKANRSRKLPFRFSNSFEVFIEVETLPIITRMKYPARQLQIAVLVKENIMKKLFGIVACLALCFTVNSFAIDLDLGASMDHTQGVKNAQAANEPTRKKLNWSAGMPVDIKTGALSNRKDNLGQSARVFQTLYSQTVDFSKSYQVKGSRGEITAYYDSQNKLQIRGVYQGTQFDSGAKRDNKFQGRSLLIQGANANLQFHAAGLTVILANSYLLHYIKDEDVKKKLSSKANFGVLPTAIMLSTPQGLQMINSFDEVVSLN